MPFEQRNLELAISQSRGIFNTYIYETADDTVADVQVAGYFAASRFTESDPEDWPRSQIQCLCSDGYVAGFISADGTSLVDPIGDPGETDLSVTRTATSVTIASSTGTDAVIPAVTTADAGVMIAADKTKLDTVAFNAQPNVGTSISLTRQENSLVIRSSTGGDGFLSGATAALAGAMTGPDRVKLDAIEAGAQVNALAAFVTTGTATTFSAVAGGKYVISNDTTRFELPASGTCQFIILSGDKTIAATGMGQQISIDISGTITTAAEHTLTFTNRKLYTAVALNTTDNFDVFTVQ